MKGRAFGALEKTLAGLVKAQTDMADERSRLLERIEEIDAELEKLEAAGAALRPLVSTSGGGNGVRPTRPTPERGMRSLLLEELRRHPGEILSPRQLAEILDADARVVAMNMSQLGSDVEHMVGRGYRWRGPA